MLLLVVHVLLGGAFEGALAQEGGVRVDVEDLLVILIPDDGVLVVVEVDDFVQQDRRLVPILVLELFGLRDTLEEVENLLVDWQAIVDCLRFQEIFHAFADLFQEFGLGIFGLENVGLLRLELAIQLFRVETFEREHLLPEVRVVNIGDAPALRGGA